MSEPINTREVDFHQYCERCMHFDKEEWEDPCWECLENPVNVNSQKPIRYEEKAHGRREREHA